MKAVARKDLPKPRIRIEDRVQVIGGKSKGEIGEVIRVDLVKSRVYVKDVNMQKKHTKPRRQGEPGGIIPIEGPIHLSKVLLYCTNCKKGVRTRVQVVQKGVKNRICAKCGETIS